jgi:hypothetical protein
VLIVEGISAERHAYQLISFTTTVIDVAAAAEVPVSFVAVRALSAA